jgi:hypothetical protein
MKAVGAVAVRILALMRWLTAAASLAAVPLAALILPWMTSDALRKAESGGAAIVLAGVLIGATVLVIGGGYTSFLAMRAELGSLNFASHVPGAKRRRVLVGLGGAALLVAAQIIVGAGDVRSIVLAASLGSIGLYAVLWALRPPRQGAGETLPTLLKNAPSVT